MKNLLELLGIRQKRARPVGQSLEKSKEGEKTQTARKRLVVKGVIIALLLALVMAAFPRENTYQIAVQVGDVWRDENLVAPFDFPIYKSEEALEAERRAVRREVDPVFQLVPDAREQSMARIDSLAAYFDRLFEAYGAWQLNRSRGSLEEAQADSSRYRELRANAPVDLPARGWEILLHSYLGSVPGLATPSRTAGTDGLLSQELIDEVVESLSHLYRNQVLNIPKDSLRTEEIVVRNREARTERTAVPMRSVYGIQEAYAYIIDQLNRAYVPNSDTVQVGLSIFQYALEPSLIYLEEETAARVAERQESISRIRGKVQEGQVIVRTGEVVDGEILAMLSSLERFRAERSGDLQQWMILLGQFLLVASILMIFFLYLYLLHADIFHANRQVLLIAILFGLIVGMFGITVRLDAVPVLAVPVGIASILLTVVYNSRVGIVGTVALALLGGALTGFSFEIMLATTFAGVLVVFSVRDMRNRGQIVVSAGLALAAYVIVVGGFALLGFGGLEQFRGDMLLVLINAVLILFAHPLLWIVERTFNITTDLTLLELSDTNRPLLKELSMRAPGTFHHALQVANLGEAAADAIGANGLEVRVGALYHDVGKMLKPEYFIENQRVGENPHDKLSPHMSALILASHVKDGLELARQHGLPQAVLNYIPMHHGTTLMEYFYRKAQEQEVADDSPISEAEFRYPGPIPHSNETGILMLADSVEAAGRSLEKPTPRKLETLVDSIFKSRIEDGQLDHSPLTFADLEAIKQTFMNILSSMHHIRVKYPGQEEEEPQDGAEAAAEESGQEAFEDAGGDQQVDGLEGEGGREKTDDSRLPPPAQAGNGAPQASSVEPESGASEEEDAGSGRREG